MSRTKKLLVQDDDYICVLFVTPVVTNLHEYRFEVYTLVSEIHVNMDMVMQIKLCMK